MLDFLFNNKLFYDLNFMTGRKRYITILLLEQRHSRERRLTIKIPINDDVIFAKFSIRRTDERANLNDVIVRLLLPIALFIVVLNTKTTQCLPRATCTSDRLYTSIHSRYAMAYFRRIRRVHFYAFQIRDHSRIGILAISRKRGKILRGKIFLENARE